MLGTQITQFRLPNGKTVNLVDWTDKPLFSTIELLDSFTDQEIQAFTYTVSNQVASSSNITTARIADERDTNLSTPAAMASTEEMLVYAIKVEFFEFDITGADATTFNEAEAGLPIPLPWNIAILNRACLLRLEVSQKIYAEAGLGQFVTGFGVWGFSASADGARSFGNQGVPSQESVRSFVVPTHIGGQEKYNVTLANPAGAAVVFRTAAAAQDADHLMRLCIYLDGLYKRPVA